MAKSKQNMTAKPFVCPKGTPVDTQKIYGLPAANIIKQPVKMTPKYK